LKFGVIFLVLSVVGVLTERSLGVFGFYAVSIAGAAAGTAAAHHQVSLPVAASGAVLATLTSAFINIPIVARAGGQLGLTKALARSLLIVIAFGVFGLLVHKPLETAFRSVLRMRKTPAANTQ
jgi:membrane associated rhomboid family serine protease